MLSIERELVNVTDFEYFVDRHSILTFLFNFIKLNFSIDK